jgi:hypothetical protein
MARRWLASFCSTKVPFASMAAPGLPVPLLRTGGMRVKLLPLLESLQMEFSDDSEVSSIADCGCCCECSDCVLLVALLHSRESFACPAAHPALNAECGLSHQIHCDSCGALRFRLAQFVCCFVSVLQMRLTEALAKHDHEVVRRILAQSPKVGAVLCCLLAFLFENF